MTKLYKELLLQGENHPLFDQMGTMEHADITRGHYFRGVL